MLTYIWLKWADNHDKTNDHSLSMESRASAAKRCELMQKFRRILIQEIDKIAQQQIVI